MAVNNVLKDKLGNILNPKIPRYENLKNYSEEEQLVGFYLDRTYYKKVVEFGAFPSNGQRTVNHNRSDLDDIICYFYSWYDTTDAKWFSGIRIDSSSIMCKLSVDLTNLVIEGLGEVAWADRTTKGKCTIYYHKTTD